MQISAFSESPKPAHKACNSTRSGAVTILTVFSLVLAGCQATAPNQNETISTQDVSTAPRSKARSKVERLLLPESTSSQVAATTDIDSDEFISELYSYAKQNVAEHFDISLDDVALKLASNNELEFFVRRETKKLSHAVFNNNQFADFFVGKVMQDQAGSYAGLFVSPEKSVVLNRDLLAVFRDSLKADASLSNASQERELVAQSLVALLIHELVHAADDQRFQIHSTRDLNFRSSVAQSAVFEGHAQLATREICSKIDCLIGLQRLDAFMFEAPEPADPVARSLQAVSRNVLEYAYVEGERFLQSLQNLPDGVKRLESALRNPPQDPVQILDPENYPDLDRVERNREIFKQLVSIEHKWNSPKYALIETSPIKGLDLRSDPERRAATKEGFTRLIRSMVGAQLFDQQATEILPIEITVMQTDDAETADLFARSFQQKAVKPNNGNKPGTSGNTLHLTIGGAEGTWPMRVFLAATPVDNKSSSNPDNHYMNLIASAGKWIIQMGGIADPQDASMISFSEQAMLELLSSEPLKKVSK